MEDRRVLRVVPINILMHWSDKNKGIALDLPWPLRRREE